MTYTEIMEIEDIQEKEDKLKEFYITEIQVEEWLSEKSRTQKIRFKDRWEYKMNGVYHRLNGPAIDFHKTKTGFYYLYGEALSQREWEPKAQQILREKKLKRTLNG